MSSPRINIIRQIISWIAFHRVIQLQSRRLELGVHLSVHLDPRGHFDLGELSPHFAFKSSFSIYSIVVVMSTLWKSNCNWNIRFSNQRKSGVGASARRRRASVFYACLSHGKWPWTLWDCTASANLARCCENLGELRAPSSSAQTWSPLNQNRTIAVLVKRLRAFQIKLQNFPMMSLATTSLASLTLNTWYFLVPTRPPMKIG